VSGLPSANACTVLPPVVVLPPSLVGGEFHPQVEEGPEGEGVGGLAGLGLDAPGLAGLAVSARR